jgi:ATP-dependent DNA helicase PIF1
LSPETKNDITAFSRWLLDIGDGKIPARAKDNETENS